MATANASRSAAHKRSGSRADLISQVCIVAKPNNQLRRLAWHGGPEGKSIAGNGNRTRMASLEGWNYTIKLCPRLANSESVREEIVTVAGEYAKAPRYFSNAAAAR